MIGADPTGRERGTRTRAFRLGVDAHVLDGKYQGSRTWLEEILRRAPALLPDVQFVVYSSRPASHVATAHGSNVEHRRLAHLPAPARIAAYWPFVITRDRLDGLLTQYISPVTHPSRQLVVVHDVLFETHPWFFPRGVRLRNQLLVRLSARRAARLITVSEYSRTQLSSVYGVDPARVAIVRNGVDRSIASTAKTTPLPEQLRDVRYVLMVGRLEPRKNARLALQALALVDDPNLRLVVVGRDDFEEPEVLAALRAEPRVVHLVDVPPALLAALYRDAAALLFPSLGEGWGIPVVEALAAGTPVIASDATAIPEAGGALAHYVDCASPGAAEEFARLIRRALAGELDLPAGAVAAHLDGLSWDRSAAAFAETVRALQSSRHAE